jgi:glycosyltransferase involved in cell wall biosynthesis/SAM-dependent methyltransferase
MRIAFFSPMPPVKSGIADYSAALLEPMKRMASISVFEETTRGFDASQYDSAIYQIGNNPHHVTAYETALAHPGIVVLHEANLHHLITEITIRRGDWDEYLREVERNRGAAALAYAKKYVATLQRGPDYEGVPMLRAILDRARGVVVHSRFVADEIRREGYRGPIAVIPHGAWLIEPERLHWRERMGLDEQVPLIGTFGFLKPYKRIAQSLRAFARLLKVEPRARMVLVGEPHPELPLDSMIQSLGIEAAVRVIGFAPIEEFNGYLSACDVVLNLRYPTVGESSGTLLRALGMGKAVIVSDVGSFQELPDAICLKTPVDVSEEDYLFEYLNLLVSRPEVARGLGAQARNWVETECSWESVAARYLEFASAVAEGREWTEPEPIRDEAPSVERTVEQSVAIAVESATSIVAVETAKTEAPPLAPVPGDYILSWAPDRAARQYAEQHLTRFEKTLAITPPGGPDDRVLEMGAYLQITPSLKTKLGYGEVCGCYYGKAGERDLKKVRSADGEEFECWVDLFDAEKDRFPYDDGSFATVLCCELIEHLFEDPMHLMSEVNRILKPGGHFVITTPNIASLRAIAGILQGFHPMLFPAYIKPGQDGERDARHNREYTPREIATLLENAGFEVTLLDTGAFRDEPHPEYGWVEHLLDRYILPKDHRGDGIYAVGRKTGPVRERYPQWLYS